MCMWHAAACACALKHTQPVVNRYEKQKDVREAAPSIQHQKVAESSCSSFRDQTEVDRDYVRYVEICTYLDYGSEIRQSPRDYMEDKAYTLQYTLFDYTLHVEI